MAQLGTETFAVPARPRRPWWLYLLIVVVLGVLAAAGAVVALTALRHHRTVSAEATAAGLTRAGPDDQGIAENLKTTVGASAGHDPVSLAYTDPAGTQSPVYLVGGRLGLTDSGSAALQALTKTFAVSAFRSFTGPVVFADETAGVAGGTQRCTSIQVSGVQTAVCAWVDGDTVGIALSPARTPAAFAELLGRMRADIER